MKNKDEIIAFFTSDIVRETQKPVSQAGYKEGYLTKRGKNFGGWKTRYFVLQGPSLEYYESVSNHLVLKPSCRRHGLITAPPAHDLCTIFLLFPHSFPFAD